MKKILKNALATLGYRVEGIRYQPPELRDPSRVRAIEFDDVICRRMCEVRTALTFVQVGVFDGVTQDPLRKYIDRYQWRGVMIEPQSKAISRVRDLYRHTDRIALIHAAIDRHAGKRTLFTVGGESAPSWASALASFDRAHIVKHGDLIPGIEQMIREEEVPCVSFTDALVHLPEGGLDLLQVDTEGADALILSLFPFDRLRPAIVHWEVRHLSRRQRQDCFELLSSFGYQFAASGTQDMLAVLPA